MPVALVPNEQVQVGGSGFVFNPAPNTVLYQDMLRMGPNPNLYELINPSMRVDVVATGGCPDPKVPEFITGIFVKPGHGHPTAAGPGCSVDTMIDIAPEKVPDIPEMLMANGFNEPLHGIWVYLITPCSSTLVACTAHWVYLREVFL